MLVSPYFAQAAEVAMAMVRFRQSDLDRDALFAIDVDAPSLPPAVR